MTTTQQMRLTGGRPWQRTTQSSLLGGPKHTKSTIQVAMANGLKVHLGDAALTVSYCHSPGVEAYYSGNWTKSTSVTLPRSTFHQVEYAGIVNGATETEAANAFIAYLLTEEINRNMPENNLMQSVLTNASWPEYDGYRYHTDEPTLNAEITIERIGADMESWLLDWAAATL